MLSMSAMPALRAAPHKTPVADGRADVDPEAKRRKTRKGTHSCWECKRRKMKCIFSSRTETVCAGCQRRAVKCVSQEFPEDVSRPVEKDRQISNRVVRVEALVKQLIEKVHIASGEGTTREYDEMSTDGIHTPPSTGSECSTFLSLHKPSDDVGEVDDIRLYKFAVATTSPAGPGKYARLSQILHASLPSQKDTDLICRARGRVSVHFHEMLTMPYSSLAQPASNLPETLLGSAGPDVHPVLIARRMLYLATFLQHFHPDLHQEINELSEPMRTMMKRLADTAINLVVTNDELVCSIEGLECIMLAGMYEANSGNLRQGWMTTRRAMVIAQLMGIHRAGNPIRCNVLNPKSKADPHYMWFRIVIFDRQLSLILGLPQGSTDRSMASEDLLANDTDIGRFERLLCALGSRILERNESDPTAHDFALTQDIDRELQNSAKALGSKWWLSQNLAGVMNDPEALFWSMRRLANQISYYNLLNQLHLPYMLRSSALRKYDYSKMICMSASREILSRFIMFRDFNRTIFACRTVDFLALTAGMTLLLAHLDSHRSQETDNIPAYQCLSDRAMIEQAQENMEELGRANADPMSQQGADLLRQLLAIEAEAADGSAHVAEMEMTQTSEAETSQQDEGGNGVVRVHIPYFGVIKIARHGGISKELPNPQSPMVINGQNEFPMVDRSSTIRSGLTHEGAVIHSSVVAGFNGTPIPIVFGTAEAGYGYMEQPLAGLPPAPIAYLDTLPQQQQAEAMVPTQFAPQFPSHIADALLQQYEYPTLTAGIDDWAFQGVDMAFFDNLMRGIGDDGIDGVEWTA